MGHFTRHARSLNGSITLCLALLVALVSLSNAYTEVRVVNSRALATHYVIGGPGYEMVFDDEWLYIGSSAGGNSSHDCFAYVAVDVPLLKVPFTGDLVSAHLVLVHTGTVPAGMNVSVSTLEGPNSDPKDWVSNGTVSFSTRPIANITASGDQIIKTNAHGREELHIEITSLVQANLNAQLRLQLGVNGIHSRTKYGGFGSGPEFVPRLALGWGLDCSGSNHCGFPTKGRCIGANLCRCKDNCRTPSCGDCLSRFEEFDFTGMPLDNLALWVTGEALPGSSVPYLQDRGPFVNDIAGDGFLSSTSDLPHVRSTIGDAKGVIFDNPGRELRSQFGFENITLGDQYTVVTVHRPIGVQNNVSMLWGTERAGNGMDLGTHMGVNIQGIRSSSVKSEPDMNLFAHPGAYCPGELIISTTRALATRTTMRVNDRRVGRVDGYGHLFTRGLDHGPWIVGHNGAKDTHYNGVVYEQFVMRDAFLDSHVHAGMLHLMLKYNLPLEQPTLLFYQYAVRDGDYPSDFGWTGRMSSITTQRGQSSNLYLHVDSTFVLTTWACISASHDGVMREPHVYPLPLTTSLYPRHQQWMALDSGDYNYAFNRTWNVGYRTTSGAGAAKIAFRHNCLRCVSGAGNTPFGVLRRENTTEPWVDLGFIPRAQCGRDGDSDEQYMTINLPLTATTDLISAQYRFTFNGTFLPDTGVTDLSGTDAHPPVLSWTRHTTASHYIIERSNYPVPNATIPRLSWSVVYERDLAYNEPTTMTWTDTTANPGYKYLYRIRVGSCGQMATDGMETAVTTPGIPFTTVLNFGTGVDKEGYVALSWDYNLAATMLNYTIYRRALPGGVNEVLNATLDWTFKSYVDYTTETSTQYIYTMISCNTFGCETGVAAPGNVPDLVPIITNFFPSTGADCGGTTLTLQGFNFGPSSANLTEIAVSGVTCASSTWRSQYEAECVTADGVATGSIIASNTIGPSNPSFQNFTSNPRPVVTDFNPKFAPGQTPTTITITGINLGDNQLDLKDIRVAGVSCATRISQSPSQAVCVTGKPASPLPPPQVPPLVGDVIVETVKGCFGGIGDYTYVVPIITKIDPFQGPFTGGTEVQVYGTDFGSSQANLEHLKFNGAICTGLTWYSDTHISCTTGPGVNGTGMPVLTTTDGGSGWVGPGVHWDYLFPWPIVFEVSPGVSFLEGGGLIIIEGLEFGFSPVDIKSVRLAGVPCTNVIWIGPGEIRCTAGNSTGLAIGHVEVETVKGGLSRGELVPFRYLAKLTIDPIWGPSAGGQRVNIIGPGVAASLDDLLYVSLGSVNCTIDAQSFISTTQISCLQIQMPAGQYLVTVATKKNGPVQVGYYGVRLPTPIIDRVSPFQVDIDGGDVVTVYGENFGEIPSGQVITINNVSCIETVWLSPVRATCEVPPQVAVSPTGPYYFQFSVSPEAASGSEAQDERLTTATSAPKDVGLEYLPKSALCEPRCTEENGYDTRTVTCLNLQCVCKKWFRGLPKCADYSVSMFPVLTEENGLREVDPSEDQDPALFEVFLETLPSSPVVISFKVSNRGEVKVKPDFLEFTPETYLAPQTVTLNGINDDTRDGDQQLELQLSVASDDDHYAGMPFPPRNITNRESRPKITELVPFALSPLLGGRQLTIEGADFDFHLEVMVGDVRIPPEATKIHVQRKDNRTQAELYYARAKSQNDGRTANNPNIQLLQTSDNTSATPAPVVKTTSQLTHSSTDADIGDDTYVQVVVFETPPMPGGYHKLTVRNLDAGNEGVLLNTLFYTDDCPLPGQFGIGKDCKDCPVGGVCPGGNRIWPKPGYWNPGEGAGFVKECTIPAACLGEEGSQTRLDASGLAVNSTCAPGYQGDFCAECETGYYLTTNKGSCQVCPDDTSFVAILITDIIVWVSVGFAALKEKETFSHCIALLLALQEVGAIGGLLPQSMPKAVREVFEFFHLFTGDIDFIKPDCSGRVPIVQTTLTKVAYTFAIGLPMWGVVFAYRHWDAWRRKDRGPEYVQARKKYFMNRQVRVLAVHITVAYFSVTNNAMNLLACQKIERQAEDETVETALVLLSQPRITCWEGDHLFLGICSLFALLFVTIGWPAIYAYKMSRQPKSRLYQDEDYQERNDFLYEPFLPHLRFGFFCELGVLLVIAVGQSFFQNDAEKQFALVGTTLALNQMWLTGVKPYYRRWEGNVLATLNFCNLLTTVLIFTSQGDKMSEAMIKALSYSLVVSIGCVVIFQACVVIYFVFIQTEVNELDERANKDTSKFEDFNNKTTFKDAKPWYADQFAVPDLVELRETYYNSRRQKQSYTLPTAIGGYGLLNTVSTSTETDDGATVESHEAGLALPNIDTEVSQYVETLAAEAQYYLDPEDDEDLMPAEGNLGVRGDGLRQSVELDILHEDQMMGFDLEDGIYDPDATMTDSESSDDFAGPSIPLDLTQSEAPPELVGIDEDGMRMELDQVGETMGETAEINAIFDDDGMRI